MDSGETRTSATAHVLLRIGARIRAERPELLRLVRAAAGCAARLRLKGLVAVDLRSGGRGSSGIAAFRAGPARVELRVDAGYIKLKESPERQAARITQALQSAGPAPRGAPSLPDAAPRPAGGKVLLFNNIMASPGKESGAPHMHQGALYIASALRAAGIAVVLSDLRVGEFSRKGPSARELDRVLALHPDVNFIGLTLYDSYFEEAAELFRLLREKTDAYLAAGALMPTLHPDAVFVHLPGVHFVVRGAGEEIVPRLLSILGGGRPSEGLTKAQEEALASLDGFLYGDERRLIWAGAERALRVEVLDRSPLDFSFLEKEHAAGGLRLSLSRGCHNACYFCTSMDKGHFRAKSTAHVGALLASYGRRLKELFGSWDDVPSAAFGVGFYDDDFLSDPARAREIFRLFRRSPFHVRFFQTGINAFYGARTAGSARSLDRATIDSLGSDLFRPKFGAGEPPGPNVYLGTESFCDAELARLGKGYGWREIEPVVAALSARDVRQAHHFIAANAWTTVDNLRESLARIIMLEQAHAGRFRVLEPVIANLKSFYGTATYRRLKREGLLGRVCLRGRLAVNGYPEFDYPLVDRDVAADAAVASFSRRVAGASPVDWRRELASL